MKLIKNKHVFGITMLWYLCVGYFVLSFSFLLFRYFQFDDPSILRSLATILAYVALSSVILFCFYQLKAILISLFNNEFFTISTSRRFKHIGYAIILLNVKYITTLLIMFDGTYNFYRDNPIYLLGIFLSPLSPIIFVFGTLILCYAFQLFAKGIKLASEMKEELDQTV